MDAESSGELSLKEEECSPTVEAEASSTDFDQFQDYTALGALDFPFPSSSDSRVSSKTKTSHGKDTSEESSKASTSTVLSLGGFSLDFSKTLRQTSHFPKKDESYIGANLSVIGRNELQTSSSNSKAIAKHELSLLDDNDKQEQLVIKQQAAAVDSIGSAGASESSGFWRKFFSGGLHRGASVHPAHRLLPSDTLTRYFALPAATDYLSTPTDFSGGAGANINTSATLEVANDLNRLFQSMQLSDVTLSVGGESFQAHKVILAARSPVFAAMFNHKMREQASSLVEIPDVDPKVFHEMLKFLYSGRVDNIDEMGEDLLAAADKYAVHSLKRVCEKELASGLSVENAAHLLYLGDLHSATQLEARAVDFIASRANQVLQTQGWKSLETQHPRLMSKVLQKIVSQR